MKSLENIQLVDYELQLAWLLEQREELMAALRAVALNHLGVEGDRDDDTEELVQEWARDPGWDQFREAFCQASAILCGNPSGLYDLWGLDKAVLAGRGFLIEFGDLTLVDDFKVYGEWGPVDDELAYRAAFLDAYVAAWDQIALPPMAGERWEGDKELVSLALGSLLVRSMPAREMFADWFPRAAVDALGLKDVDVVKIFGVRREDLDWGAGLSKGDVMVALTDGATRDRLVDMFLSLTEGCP